MPSRSEILAALRALERWLEEREWRAFEPHDGLNTPLRELFGSNPLVLLALKQFVQRFPINVRSLLRIPAGTSPEAVGFFARGFLRLYQISGEPADRVRAESHFKWLIGHTEPGYARACWGNQFEYITRFFHLPKGMPIVVWTAHNAHALLDGFTALGDERYLSTARSAAEFVLRDLPRRPEPGGECISYVPCGYYSVHNANLLGASLLARVGGMTADHEMLDVARKAVSYTVRHQRSDGSFLYGEAPNLMWVDNFHTGYVLDCLLLYAEATGDRSFCDSMFAGLDYYIRTFFLDDGTPRYFASRTYPIDIQAAAQSIETLIAFARHRSGLREQADRVAGWTLSKMRDRSGYFYFRRGMLWTNRTPLLHWGQATMFSALAGLLAAKSAERARG